MSVLLYEDPLISLIKDPELNKSKEKSNELLTIINNFQSKELHKVKRKCILGFQILRDLERLELRTKNWEFLSLDFSISNLLNESSPASPTLGKDGGKINDIKLKFNRDILKKVLNNCVEMHGLINDLTTEINDCNSYIRQMDTWEYISDPGTILTQLMLRCINLKQKLTEQLTILYSKLKLINIGIDLEMLLETGGNFEQLTESTIQSYRDFIDQLLRQLNDAIESNDSIEIMECVEIVNDVETMFESISLDRDDRMIAETAAPIVEDEPTVEVDTTVDLDDVSSSFSDDDRKMFEYKKPRRLSLSSVSTQNSMLQKTSLQDELPYLMTAFDNAKTVGEEIREFRTPTSTGHVHSPKSSLTHAAHAKTAKKSVYFGPLLPPAMQLLSHGSSLGSAGSSPPLQESFIPQLSSSYVLDKNSTILSKLGIKPQVIQIDSSQLHHSYNANQHHVRSINGSSSPISTSSVGYSRFGPGHHNNNLLGVPFKKNNTLTESNLNTLNKNVGVKKMEIPMEREGDSIAFNNEEDEID